MRWFCLSLSLRGRSNKRSPRSKDSIQLKKKPKRILNTCSYLSTSVRPKRKVQLLNFYFHVSTRKQTSLFIIQLAVNLLNLAILSNIGNSILQYLPLVVSATIIMGGGIILASWVERLITKHSPKQKTVALIIKILIIVLAVFMTLSQLGFAQDIVNLAFVILMAGAAVAFAIAFGLGGRNFAANRLAKLEKKLDETAGSHPESAEEL